jgi:AcrR family transcriptional regulator
MTAALIAQHVDSTSREAILDAAERRFAEAGFDGASTREIAADAGLRNQASLYHYFGNKEALYEAVLSRGIETLLDVVRESARAGVSANGGAGPRRELMTSYLDRTFDYLVAHPHLARLIQRASLGDSDLARETLARLAQPLFEGGVRLLREMGGAWPDQQLPHLAAGLYHLIFGYFSDVALLRVVMPDDPANDAAIERQRSFVRGAIARLLGP